MITSEAINHYIEALIPPRSLLLARLEAEAKEEGIPIIQLPSIQFIRTIFQACRPARILEVGTAIGYSAIWLAQAAEQSRITTMEIDEGRIGRAKQNFREAGLEDRIEIIAGDAGNGLPADYRFDCLFLDAAKGQYKAHLDLFLPHLDPQGIVICDNVLFKGLVAEDHVANKRLAPMVKKLREFNKYIMNHPELETSFIPIGDGLTFSVKKGE